MMYVAPGTHYLTRDIAKLLTEPSRPAPERAAGHLILALVEMGQGRRGAAGEALRAGERLNPAAALEMRGLLALAPFLPRSGAELESLRAEIERWDGSAPTSSGMSLTVHDSVHSQLRLYVLGLLSANLGEGAAANRYAGELERMGGPVPLGTLIPDLALGVRAEAARARGDAAEALSLRERARMEVPFGSTVGFLFFLQDRERYLRAELLSQAGRHEEAIGWYTAVTESSIAYSAVAHLRLGEIQEKLGNRPKAAQHYARFVTLWQDCDPELRPLREGAERRLVALRGGA